MSLHLAAITDAGTDAAPDKDNGRLCCPLPCSEARKPKSEVSRNVCFGSSLLLSVGAQSKPNEWNIRSKKGCACVCMWPLYVATMGDCFEFTTSKHGLGGELRFRWHVSAARLRQLYASRKHASFRFSVTNTLTVVGSLGSRVTGQRQCQAKH
ncbi:hypothetical protein ZHAS_00012423 [Anopheles sinensis]|uniref:Uncharacterized protein n=1 Tax=Anopheles sinensis TaxID=74873 RepID=A0A084W2V0_ANOSI|nr:hypothetical protein ZHAS_00012423 [Anopheles sinensis]